MIIRVYKWYCLNCKRRLSYKEVLKNYGECPTCNCRDIKTETIEIIEKKSVYYNAKQ